MRAIVRAIIGVASIDAFFFTWWLGEYQLRLSRTIAQSLGALAAGLTLTVALAAIRLWRAAPRQGAWAPPSPGQLRAYPRTSAQTGWEREAIESVTMELTLIPSPATPVPDTSPPPTSSTTTPSPATPSPATPAGLATVAPPPADPPAPRHTPAVGEPYGPLRDASLAVPTYEKILAGREKRLGADHEETIKARGALASACWAIGQLDRAIALYERTVAESGRVLGAQHPYTLAARNDLAATYELDGRIHDAIALYERNLHDFARTLGANHPQTVATRENLSVARAVQANLGYREAGRPDPASGHPTDH